MQALFVEAIAIGARGHTRLQCDKDWVDCSKGAPYGALRHPLSAVCRGVQSRLDRRRLASRIFLAPICVQEAAREDQCSNPCCLRLVPLCR